MAENEFKDLQKFSKAVGISPERLIQAYEIEKEFHYKILNESSKQERKKLYHEVYPKVHKIYGKAESDITTNQNPKEFLVTILKKELENKSILDVGCGEGYFLSAVADKLKSQELVGIDISIPPKSFLHKSIKFVKSDIIDFILNDKFDVVIADQVLEHIAPADLPSFFSSVKNVIKSGGKFILLLPNLLFGPSDVTRIKDYSQSGKIKAEGTHLFETTYAELLPILENYGFKNFRTICQIPKLKKWVPNLRYNAQIMKFVENNKFLLEFIYKLKYRGFPLLRFEIVLICSVT